MLVNCAKHTKSQCACTSTCATCTHVGYVFAAPTLNENLSTRMGRHAQESQYYH